MKTVGTRYYLFCWFVHLYWKSGILISIYCVLLESLVPSESSFVENSEELKKDAEFKFLTKARVVLFDGVVMIFGVKIIKKNRKGLLNMFVAEGSP